MGKMDGQIQYPWQQALVDAFLAATADAPMKVKIAEQTILTRLRERRQVDSSELMALEDGLRALKVLVSEAKAEAAEKNRVERTHTSTVEEEFAVMYEKETTSPRPRVTAEG
jgi:hypothetical protein